MTTPLKPCPFCRAKETDTFLEIDGSEAPALCWCYCETADLHFVKCYSCGARGPGEPTKADAVDSWNNQIIPEMDHET